MAQFKCLNVRSGSWRHTRQCLSPSHSHVIDLSPQHWAESIDFLKLLATVNPHWQQDVYLPGLLGPHYCPRCAKHWWLNNYVPDCGCQLLFFFAQLPLSLRLCSGPTHICSSASIQWFFKIYLFFIFLGGGVTKPHFSWKTLIGCISLFIPEFFLGKKYLYNLWLGPFPITCKQCGALY